MKFHIGLVIWLLMQATVFANPLQSNQTPPGYAIATADPHATRAAMEMFKQGGNAFDAAVAVSAALAVAEPYHSGIGGGGFWMLYIAKQNRTFIIDGRETAPLAASSTMYLNLDGSVNRDKALNGPLSAGIPGQVAAMAYIAEHFGRLGLAKNLQPAIELARDGFEVNQDYLTYINYNERYKVLQRYPASAKQFLIDNKVPRLGQLIKQPDLATTLQTIAKQGHDGFYLGPVAKKLVSAVQKNGGLWTEKDLQEYQLKFRKPLIGRFNDMRLITMPPPSAGGIALITMFNILDKYSLQSFTDSQRLHYLIEAMRLAFWDRAKYLGDPDFIRIPVNALISSTHANHLRSFIKPNQATPSSELPKQPIFADSSDNTTHFSIIDQEGNIVSATLSVNYLFGSGFVAEGTGVLLNDEMDDFTAKVGAKNVFGLEDGQANIIEPGKRPLSSMSPSIIVTKDKVAVIGSPGGSRIITIILLGILDFLNGHDPSSWVSVPRIHHQYLPDKVFHEPSAITLSQQQQLKDMGYQLEQRTPWGDMQAVLWDKKTNRLYAASDPRHHGHSVVIYNDKN